MSIEALRNIIHREVLRVLDRRIRRVPCIVDSYNPSQHTVKVKLQPSGTLTGWTQIETAQVGLLIAPSIGDPGWLEFHEADARAAVFVGSNHNDNFPPPQEIQSAEFFYKNKSGSSLYFKSDGSIKAIDSQGGSINLAEGVITATDKVGSSLTLNGSNTATLKAALIVLDGAVQITGRTSGRGGSGAIEIDAAVTIVGSITVE
jgi:phage baseplate assembly protein gpV